MHPHIHNVLLLHNVLMFSAGVYCPRAKGHSRMEVCLDYLAEHIAEARECQLQLYNYTIVIYVNMCDMNGKATPDVYI